jgi:hypothetical protein
MRTLIVAMLPSRGRKLSMHFTLLELAVKGTT